MSHPQVAEKLIWRETIDGIVIIDPAIGKVRVLNGVGSMIWKLIAEEKKNVEEVVVQIVDEYEIEKEQASKDLDNFLQDLTSRNILRWVD